eukprot:PhM_4_TR797/c0_g1_i1/m.12088
MKALYLVALLALIGCAAAADPFGTFAESYPDGHPFCNKNGFKRVDQVQYYKVNTPVVKTICVLDYFDVCYTVDGSKPCNRGHSKCVEVGGEWDNAALNPISASRMTDRPQVCAAEGGFWHAELAVLAVAQPVVAWCLFLYALVIVIRAIRAAGASIAHVITTSFMFFNLSFLIFSFWYLNAYLGLMAVLTASGLYASKNKKAVVFGMVLVFLTLLWFTYLSGLGMAQHYARLSYSDPERYSTMCVNYYRGYFAYPLAIHGAFESPNTLTRNYCQREVIGLMLFFVFATELLFLVVIGLGAFAATKEEEEEKEQPEVAEQEAVAERATPAPAPAPVEEAAPAAAEPEAPAAASE